MQKPDIRITLIWGSPPVVLGQNSEVTLEINRKIPESVTTELANETVGTVLLLHLA